MREWDRGEQTRETAVQEALDARRNAYYTERSNKLADIEMALDKIVK